MTAFNKKAFKGLPTGIKVRKPRYYYQDFVETYTENTTKDLTLTKFEGVNYEIDKYFINFESRVLWNRNLSPEFKAALVPYGLGEEYITTEQSLKYNVVGNPTINDNVASGFSGSKYIQIPNAFKPANESWEFVLKLTLTTNTKQQRLAGCVGGYYKTFGLEMSASGIVGVGITSNGSSWDVCWMNGVTALQVGIPYWIKVSFTGTQYKLELSTDGVEYTLENSKNSTALLYQKNDSIINIGYMGTETSKYFQGSIDLNESYIKIGSKYVWGKNARYIITTGGCFDEDVNISLSSTKTYNAFADNSKVLLSESNEDKDGYTWAGEVVIPPYPYEPVYKKRIVDSSTDCTYFVRGSNVLVSYNSNGYSLLKEDTYYNFIPETSFFDYDVRFTAKVTTGTSGTHRIIGRVGVWLTCSAGKFQAIDKSLVSDSALANNTVYWVRAGETYDVSTKQYTHRICYIKDNGYTKTTLPDESKWTVKTKTDTTAWFSSTTKIIGFGDVDKQNKGYSWDGTIDLRNTWIDLGAITKVGDGGIIYQDKWKPLVDVIWDESDKELM